MSTSSSGKEQGIAKARDPGDDNATEHAKHLLPDREDDVVEQQLFKLNEFLTEVVKEMPIQGHDTMNLTAGKLVIEQGDSLKLASSAPGHVKFIASILETLN